MKQISATALQAILAQETDEVFIPLLKIEHTSLSSPIQLAHNSETVTRTDDGDYLPYPFQVNLPEQDEAENIKVTITIDNTDLVVNDQLRSLVGMPKVTLMVVLASTPDTVEAGPFVMSLAQISADMHSITGTLGYEQGIFDQQVPGQTYEPGNSAGMFL